MAKRKRADGSLYKDILRADLILDKMAKTYRERNAMYGNNWKKHGYVMAALFPDGITLRTPDDFTGFHFMDWAVGKQTRFVNSGMEHNESIHDAAVYMAMFEAFNETKDKK